MTIETSRQERVGNRPRVLVIEDFDSAREVYVRILQAGGFEVEEAASGPEGIKKALALQPELILMDLLMTGMDGWAAARLLKADARTAYAPIVVITGAPHTDGARRAQEAGCDAYLVKPCLPQTLLKVVRDLLGAGAPAETDAGSRPGATSA